MNKVIVLKSVLVATLLITGCNQKPSEPQEGGDQSSIPPVNVSYGGLYEGCLNKFDAFFCPDKTRDGVLDASKEDNVTIIYLSEDELKDLNDTVAQELIKEINER